MHANKRGASANEVSRLAKEMVDKFKVSCSEEQKEEFVLDACRAMIQGSRRLRNAHWKKIIGDVQHYPYDHTATDSFEGVPIKHDTPPASIDKHQQWFLAAIKGDVQRFEKFAPLETDILLGYGPFIPSALHVAIVAGRENIVRYMLNHFCYHDGPLVHLGYTLHSIALRLCTAIDIAARQRRYQIARMVWQFLKKWKQSKG